MASLAAGTVDPLTGVWTLTPAELANLTLNSPDGFTTGTFALSVTATTTELDGGDEISVPGTVNITIAGDGTADAPRLDLDSGTVGDQLVGAVSGLEDTAIKLDINAELTDDTESLSVTISDIPDGVRIFIVNPGEEPVEIQPDGKGDYQIPPGLFELGGKGRSG